MSFRNYAKYDAERLKFWYLTQISVPYLMLFIICVKTSQFLCMSVGTSLAAQKVKRLPTMPETRVRSLGQEDPLEKEMATHSSTLACKIPWTDKPGRLQPMGSQRVGHDWATSLHFTSREQTLILVVFSFVLFSFVNFDNKFLPSFVHFI